jgi:hypothetical protein
MKKWPALEFAVGLKLPEASPLNMPSFVMVPSILYIR